MSANPERQRQPLVKGAHHVECNCERCKEPDIVQVQKEAWARIAEEERRDPSKRPVQRWAS